MPDRGDLGQLLVVGLAQHPLLERIQPFVQLLVEAAIKCGDRAAATAAFEGVAPWWRACDTPWSPGLLARCEALLADDDHAEDA